MKLYVQFAQPYEGYVSGWLDVASGVWEPLRLGDAPEPVGQLLGRSGARFFLGTLGQRRCLCIRGIPDEIRDESGRACYIHMMVDAPLSKRRDVDRLAAFALAEKPQFQAEMRKLIRRDSSHPCLDAALASALLSRDGEWKLPGRPDDILLMPEQSIAHFTRETGISVNPAALRLLFEEESPTKLLFYCSAPAYGYTFTLLDGPSGKTLARRDEAIAALPAGLYRRMTTQGENSALFHEDGCWCFFIRPIPTPSSGKLTLAVVSTEEASLRRMVAWAQENPSELNALAADCIIPNLKEGEYTVDAAKAAALCQRMLDRDAAEQMIDPEPSDTTMKTSSQNDPEEDEDRIDLLKYRWFRLAAIVAGAGALAGVIWMLLRLID